MYRKRILMTLVVLFLSQNGATYASDPADNIRLKLASLVPGMSPDSIVETPIKDLYEVSFGAQIMYFSSDGRYMLRGNLIDIDKREDLTENTRSKARKTVLEKVKNEEMIVFSLDKPKHTITVFTDIDCPYCQKLHSEIEEYKKAGIEVRYLLYPRAGVDSPSYKKAVSVWCADDSNKALTDAKQGKKIENKTCENPVEQQMTIGQMIGVNGTPAIVLEDGELLPGYRPVKEMAMVLDSLTEKN